MGYAQEKFGGQVLQQLLYEISLFVLVETRFFEIRVALSGFRKHLFVNLQNMDVKKLEIWILKEFRAFFDQENFWSNLEGRISEKVEEIKANIIENIRIRISTHVISNLMKSKIRNRVKPFWKNG